MCRAVFLGKINFEGRGGKKVGDVRVGKTTCVDTKINLTFFCGQQGRVWTDAEPRYNRLRNARGGRLYNLDSLLRLLFNLKRCRNWHAKEEIEKGEIECLEC